MGKSRGLADSFAKILKRWYRLNARNLPWRGSGDPYQVMVSEFILQQTQIGQGTAYFFNFMERFPGVRELALADEAEVLKVWQGLGYYSRARNLHRAAQQIMAQGGKIPQTYDSLIRLPGIGAYTAAAISSICFGEPRALVDGNVARFLSRWSGLLVPVDQGRGKQQLLQLAEELLDKQFPGDHNQGLMEFGALVCLPQNPKCQDCPFATSCKALELGKVHAIPFKTPKQPVRNRFFTYVLLTTPTSVFLRKRPTADIWEGFFEPVLLEADELLKLEELRNCQPLSLLEPTRILEVHQTVPDLTHQLSHQKIFCRTFLVILHDEVEIQGFESVSFPALPRYPVSRLVEKILERLPVL